MLTYKNRVTHWVSDKDVDKNVYTKKIFFIKAVSFKSKIYL